jgi:hypothetical protein
MIQGYMLHMSSQPSCTPGFGDVFVTVSYCHIIAPDSESAIASVVSDSDIQWGVQ